MSGFCVRSFIMAARSCVVLAAFGATTVAQAGIIFAGGTGSPMTLQFTAPLAFTLTSVPSSPSFVLIIEDAYLSSQALNVGNFTAAADRPTLSYLTTTGTALDVRVGIAGGAIANTDVLVNFSSLSPSIPNVGSTLTIGTGTATTSTAMVARLPNNLGLRNVFLVDFSSGQQRTNVLQTTISIVPEPASIGLAAIGGIAAAGWWTLRRRRRAGRRIADGL